MSSTRYIDQDSYETYNDHDGQETIVTKLVSGTPGVVFDTWIEHVWQKYALKDIHPGEGRGLKGHVRAVPLGIHEEIIAVGEPRDLDDEAIPSVLYKLRKFGPIPCKDHIGYVRFVQDTSKSASGEPQTLVIWSIKTVPTTVGNVLFCGGSLVRMGLRSALSVMLRLGLTPKTLVKKARRE